MIEYLEFNGYDENLEEFGLGWAFPREPDCPPGETCAHYHLVVSGTQTVGLTFLRVLGFETVDVSAHAIGENANRLDVAIVLDVTGSMANDTCDSAAPHGCDQSWWSEIHEIIYEDFEGYTLGDGDSDPNRLCGSNSPWSCERPWQVGARSNSRNFSGNHGQTEGDGSDGRFYMNFDASSYDQIEVVLRERTYSAGWGDYNAAWYSRDGGGWTRFMNQSNEDSWDWRAYLLQGQTSDFGIRFGSRYMEGYDFGLFDNISIKGMVNGPEPSGPLGICPGYGESDCAGGGYKKQPIWDTLNAADWFITECMIGTGDGATPCLDPDLDQVGLVYVQSMRSATYLQPGERLVCQGCHDRRHQVPQMPRTPPVAFRRPPSRLQADVDGSNPFSYPRLVQPVLDRHCVDCHAKESKKTFSLSKAPMKGRWYGSYANLTQKYGFWNYGHSHRTTPGQFGARASGL